MNENLQIDPSQLDEEWLQQPLLFDQAQQEAADCLETRDELKNKLAWLEADRAAYLRSAWEREEFKKPPAQGVVDDWVMMRPEVEVLKAELREANHNLNLANNAVESLQMKKRALEKLCDLHISNYFSVPNPNHMLDGGKRFLEDKANKVEEGSAKATEGLNEKKKARKTKEEVLDKIKNPDTKAEAKKRIEAEEEKATEEQPVKRRRRR